MMIIKRFFKSIAVAFSMYSTIPMPRFDWGSEDMEYHLIFFPFVGTLIGALEYLWLKVAAMVGAHGFTRVLFIMAIPLIITGGFHVDGFMDTCDALKSYGNTEKKLEILKDPHIGAFSVICLVTYLLLAGASINEIADEKVFLLLLFVPTLIRTVSGLIVTYMTPVKKDGMLRTSSDNNKKKVVGPILIVFLILTATAMLMVSFDAALVILIFEALFFLYFRWLTHKQFGGVTGDLAGFYVCMAELTALITAAVYGWIR